MMIRFTACLAAVVLSGVSLADSALPLLSGFDRDRIEATYPPSNDESAGELAKLIYRLRGLDPKTLADRAGSVDQLGDVILIDGEIHEIRAVDVPPRLIEFLELARLKVLTVKSPESEVRVITTALPPEAQRGDRVSGAAIAIETGRASDQRVEVVAVASPRLAWFPVSPSRPGWQLLSQAGVDISLLSEIVSRNRQPLLAVDGDAFYAMLAAAGDLGKRRDLPVPERVDSVKLLVEAEEMSGQWLRMELETVQVTRIAVTQPDRQAQLGRDHYYQVDAVGDLGNVVIQLQTATADDRPAATFEGRYPVSLVIRQLPPFLVERIRLQEGGAAIVSQIRTRIEVDAFFYRLWSYQSDFMSQQASGGDQFGPLLIATRIVDREPAAGGDPAGVRAIGFIAAWAVIVGIVAIWWWNRRLAAQDRRVREKRKLRESQQVQLP